MVGGGILTWQQTWNLTEPPEHLIATTITVYPSLTGSIAEAARRLRSADG